MGWRSASACTTGGMSMLGIGTAYAIAVYPADGMNAMGGMPPCIAGRLEGVQENLTVSKNR